MNLRPTRRLTAFALLSLIASLLLVDEASAAHVTCGQTIVANTTLDSDVGPCPGTGIIVGASNITLNLNGHRVFATAGVPGEGAGIHLVGRSGVRIINGTVEFFDAGIAIEGGGSNTVQGMTLNRNEGDSTTDFGDGLALNASHDNVIQGNTVTRNAPYDGIGLFGSGGSDRNRIMGNVVTDNVGTRTIGPHGPTEEDDGIRLENGSQFNVVSGNTVLRNGLDGIAVFFQSTDNIIQGNDVRENGFHEGTTRPGDGIRVFTQANRTLVQGNQSFGNASNGIEINSQQNRILANQTGANVSFDLFDTNAGGTCDANVWAGNTFTTAAPPCTTL